MAPKVIVFLLLAVFLSNINSVPLTGRDVGQVKAKEEVLAQVKERIAARLQEADIPAMIRKAVEQVGLPKETGNANYYMDEVLALLRPMIADSGLDPLILPSVASDISGGHVALYNGWLMGLSSMHRSGDATIDMTQWRVSLAGKAGFTNMQAGYKLQLQVWGIDTDAEAYALIRSLDFYFASGVNILTGNVTIDDFQLYDMGDVDMQIHGLAPFDWLFDSLSELIINSVKDEILQQLTTTIRYLLELALSIVFPSNTTTAAPFTEPILSNLNQQ